MRLAFTTACVVALAAFSLTMGSSHGSPKSDDLVLVRSVVASAGRTGSTSGFRLSGTLGQMATGTGWAVGLTMHNGYWQDFRQVICGDPSKDKFVDIDDILYLINYVFLGGVAPDPEYIGDVNCFDGIDVDDIIYLINYIFLAGPVPCADCP